MHVSFVWVVVVLGMVAADELSKPRRLISMEISPNAEAPFLSKMMRKEERVWLVRKSACDCTCVTGASGRAGKANLVRRNMMNAATYGMPFATPRRVWRAVRMAGGGDGKGNVTLHEGWALDGFGFLEGVTDAAGFGVYYSSSMLNVWCMPIGS